MRLFIGIPLSHELRREITVWQTEHSRLPVRWIAPENLHVTLLPPWQAEPDAVIARIHEARPAVAPFQMEFEGVSFGPNPRAPRLIWAYGLPPAELLDLQKDLQEIFPELPREKRDFTLHATIARFPVEDWKKFPARQLAEPVSWSMPVTAFAVFESVLRPGGAEYRILGEIPLA